MATEPLPAEILEQVGLLTRPTFTDHAAMISYGQRTADGGLVFGGRGAPDHRGSRIRPEFDSDEAVFARLRRDLRAGRVATSATEWQPANPAGRTLADLVLGRTTELTRLPWVGHRSPPWEREPARYLGINAGLRLARAADRGDVRGRFPLGGLLDRLTGH